MMKSTIKVKAVEKAHKMARGFAEADDFDMRILDKVMDFGYKNDIFMETDFETYLAVEDEIYRFRF